METVFKTSLLCAAVTSLVACGGGSGGNTTATASDNATRQITAMDGLLYNAAVFKDSNTNLMWDEGEPLLGLTDQQGQAKVSANRGDVLGVVTLIAGSPTSLAMAQQDASYQGVSTTDMDFPNSPMAQELTLVAPPTIDVMSPYTHLLSVIQNQQNIELTDAEAVLAQQLDAEGLKFDLTDNYIRSGSAEQHKVAQLLTDAMALSPDKVTADWQGFVQEAAQVVNQMDESELNNPRLRPVVDGDTTTPAVSNTKLVANPEAWDALMEQWYQIGDISAGDSGVFFSIDLNAIPIEGGSAPLYQDPDRPNQGVDYSLIHFWAHGTKQKVSFINRLDVMIEEGGSTLTVSSDEVFKAERNDFFLVAKDHNANGEHVFSRLSLFDIRTSSANKSPTVSDSAQTDIQQLIDANWSLEKGQAFEQTLDLSQWFSDPEGDTLTYTVSGSLLDVGLTARQDQDSIIISGIPVRSYSEENIRHSVTITASDGLNFTTAQVSVQLPEVNDGMLLDANPLVGKSWYFIEEVEEDGVTKNYCSYIQFANGQVTQTLGDVYSFFGCDQAQSQTINATSYNEVNLTTIKESAFVSTKTYTVRYQQPTDTGMAYAVSIDNYNGQNNHEVRMFYSNKSEVEQRLDIDSNSAPFEYAVATGENVEQTLVTPEVGDNYIKLSFAGDVNCKQLQNHFRLNQVSGNQPNVFGGSGLCLDNIDGIDVDPHYVLKLMGKNTFTQDEPYYVHLQYREGDAKEYGESLKLNFIKD